MILFVVLELFLKVLCLVDGDAKDEEDAWSTKDILFDDVLCFVLSADFGLRVVRRKMTLFDFNVTGSLTIQRLVARVRSIFSLLLLLLLLLLCWCCCCCHRGYQTWLYYSSFPSPSGIIKRNFSNASRNSLEVGTPCPPSCSNTTDFSLL